jgi:hypothetical protein
MLLVGHASGLLMLRRHEFADPVADPARLRRRLLDRLALRPSGGRLLAQMAEVDRLAARRAPSPVVWATIALCVVGTALQLRDPIFEQIGSFVPDLFARGEYWRGVTAHFVHGLSVAPLLAPLFFGSWPILPLHLAINVGGLLVLGHLVERPLGSWRTGLILAASAVGTIAGILAAGHAEVIGASGLVAGLAGAILAVELRHPESLPCQWRLPRRLLIGAVLLQFLVVDPMLWRYVAGGAHLGGFAGGFLATVWLGRPSLEGLVPMRGQRLAALGSLGVLVMGLLGAVPLGLHDMTALERHAVRLLDAEPTPNLYRHDNAAAWFIATEGGASEFGLDLAVALADRAVAGTGRANPGILDTLAEALFQRGNRLGAVLTIDEAIRLVPHDPYFVEQRRRFTGERAADDRPPPPDADEWREAPFDDPHVFPPIDPQAPTLTI